MIFNKKLLYVLFFVFLKVFPLDFPKKDPQEEEFTQDYTPQDHNGASYAEDPKIEESDPEKNASSENDALKKNDVDSKEQGNASCADVACIPLPAITTETEVETESSTINAYTDILNDALGSIEKLPCIAIMSIDNSTASPEMAAFYNDLAKAINVQSAMTPLMLDVSPLDVDAKNSLSVEEQGGYSATSTMQEGANFFVRSKPFADFVTHIVDASSPGQVAHVGSKLVEESLLARAMNDQQKVPDFNVTSIYAPRYTEAVPKLTFKSSGDEIQTHIYSVEGRHVIQQAQGALTQNIRSIHRLKNTVFLEVEQSKILTAYSKEVESKDVGYFVASNINIDTTLKQLAAEKTVIHERLLSKQQDLQKLLARKEISETELDLLKNQLEQTIDVFLVSNKMSIQSYNQVKLIMQIIPLQNEVVEVRTQLRVNDANIKLARQCQEINKQQLEVTAQSLSDKIVNALRASHYNGCKLLMNDLKARNVNFEKEAAYYLVHHEAHGRKIAELNKKLSAAWWYKDEIKAHISKEVERAEQTKLLYQNAATCAEIFSKIILVGQEIIAKKSLEISLIEALQKYEPIIKEYGYDSSTIKYHENDLAALYQYAEHSDLTTAMSITYQEKGAVVTAVYKVDSHVSDVLERLGVNVSAINTEFTGNHVQHYVHRELIDSLNKIATIEYSSPEIDQLLKTAVTLNGTGHALNARHEIVAALSAKEACDAVIDYVKTVADISFAIADGVVEGAIGTFHMLGAAGKGTVDAITFPEETIELVHTKFNNAVLTIGKLLSGINMMREDNHYLFLHGDYQAIQEKFEQDRVAGEKIVNIFEALERKYHETPFKDKVKAVSRNFTECVLLGKIGGFLFEEGAAIADVIKLEAEIAGNSIQAIISNPQKTLAKEVVELAIKTVDKDAKLVEGVIEFIHQDAEFLAASQKDIVQGASQFIEHLEIKGARYTTLKTGEKCRLVYPEDAYTREVVWSPQKYEEIRALADDVQKIAQNVNMPVHKIERIKNHLFYDEHILRRGAMRFDPDADIAAAWERLYRGDFVKNDIQLLEHEYFESKFERLFKTDYDTAHKAAQDFEKGRHWQRNE